MSEKGISFTNKVIALYSTVCITMIKYTSRMYETRIGFIIDIHTFRVVKKIYGKKCNIRNVTL